MAAKRTSIALNHVQLQALRLDCLRLSIESHKAVTAQNAQSNGDAVLKLAAKMESFVLGTARPA